MTSRHDLFSELMIASALAYRGASVPMKFSPTRKCPRCEREARQRSENADIQNFSCSCGHEWSEPTARAILKGKA